MTTVLITGASRGIGLSMARAFAKRGDTVIATARKPGDSLRELDVRVETLDVADDASAQELAAQLQGESIDVLVHNAAAASAEGLDTVSGETILNQMEVNAVGPLRVTRALLPNLAAGSKIAIITSRMGSIGDNTSGGAYAYRMSKAALNMFGRSLAHDVKDRGVAVVTLHPGMVDTDMLRGFVDAPPSVTGARTPDAVAGDVLTRLEGLTIETTGRFLHVNGEELPW